VSTRTHSQPDAAIDVEPGLSVLFRSLPDACALISWPEGRIVAVNDGLARLADYEPHEVVGRLTTEVLWPDGSDRARFFATLGARPSFKEREVQLRGRDASLRTVLVSGETIDVRGKPHLFVIARDVSEERRVAEVLRRSEERYRTFLALSGDGMARFELEEPLDVTAPLDEQVQHLLRHAYVRECNDAYAQQYGRQRAADLLGRALAEFRGRRSPDALRVFAEARYRVLDREDRARSARHAQALGARERHGDRRGRAAGALLGHAARRHQAQARGRRVDATRRRASRPRRARRSSPRWRARCVRP
jgi:PAS domain S-box-containing protein